MKSKNTRYVPALDHVRALAALLVLFHHVHLNVGARLESEASESPYWTEAVTPFDVFIVEGHTGVALFMVMSGFIFAHIAGNRHVKAAPFLANRVLRIYPLMIFVFLLGVLVRPSHADVTDFLGLVFIPFAVSHPMDFWFAPNIYPFTTLFWAIAVEFKFYLLFPLLMGLLQRDGVRAMVVIIVATVLLRVLLVRDGADPHDLSYWTIFGRLDQFVIGMTCAVIHRSWTGRGAVPICLSALVLMGLLLFGYNKARLDSGPEDWKVLWPTAEATAWGLFIISYLHVVAWMSKPLSRVLTWIGEISFSIYLLHLVVIAVLLRVGPFPLGFTPGIDAFLNGVFLVVPATFLVSTITFRMIEQPFLQRRASYLGGNLSEHSSDAQGRDGSLPAQSQAGAERG